MELNLLIRVTELNGKGYCKITHNDEEYIIHSLCVLEDKRNQGIGTELLHSVEDIIFKLGGEYSYLYVREINEWLHEWYKRLGYVDMELECDPGFIKMCKKLV